MSLQNLSSLIVGINRYADPLIPALSGAVHDANDMKDFLINLGVPASRILYLSNEQATRSAFIEAFRRLKNLAATTPRGSPVVIYYAGHGTKVQYGQDDSPMEAIVPYDCTYTIDHTTYPILDKTLKSLIESLYYHVGDNITFISDCCFSGSISRGLELQPDSESHHVRQWSFAGEHPYPADLDSDIISEFLPDNTRGTVSSSSTHILLAACSENEEAREAKSKGIYRGVFTKSLLDLLRSTGSQISLLTPADVTHRLPANGFVNQSPQCLGDHRLRPFFHDSALPQTWFRVTYHPSSSGQATNAGYYELHAGVLHGVFEQAVFKVYENRNTNAYVASMEVQVARPCRSIFMRDDTINPPTNNTAWYAILHTMGNVERPKVFIEDVPTASTSNRATRRALDALSGQQDTLNFVSAAADCHLAIREGSDGQVTVVNRDPQHIFPQQDHRPFQVRIDGDITELTKILARSAHFFYHLHNLNTDLPQGLRIEIQEVGRLMFKDYVPNPIYRPHVKSYPNLHKIGEPILIKDTATCYGIRVINQSDRDWYVTILEFDWTCHSIEPVHATGCGGKFKTDGRLVSQGPSLELGFGRLSRESQPLKFKAPEGGRKAFSVLKFIFTATPVNLQNIYRSSSITEDTKSRKLEDGNFLLADDDPDEWCTSCIPVIIDCNSEQHKAH